MFKDKIVLAGICAIIAGVITAYSSTLIKKLITFISSPSKDTSGAYTDLFIWSFLSILKILLLENAYRMFS